MGDFGGTLNTINGGLECPAYHGGWHGEAIKLRLNRYCKASSALGLDSILIMDGCKGLIDSLAECLHDGKCPDCDQYSDSVGTLTEVSHTELPDVPVLTTTPYPTIKPTLSPTRKPTPFPTIKPTLSPTRKPTLSPTRKPTQFPVQDPTPLPIVNTPGPTHHSTSRRPTNRPSVPPIQVQQVQRTVTVEASQDATLIKLHSEDNYGGEPILHVRGTSMGPNAHDAIIRFEIPAIPVSASIYATLDVYSLSEAPDGGIFHLVSETIPWAEDMVTWDSAPDWLDRLGKIGAIKKNAWHSLEISAVVIALRGREDSVNIRIRSRSVSIAKYSSREGSHPPKITIRYDDTKPNAGSSFASSFADFKPSIPAYIIATTSNPTRKPTTMPTSRVTSITNKPGTYVYMPSDDASILELHPTDNYGREQALMIDRDSGTLDSLLRFDLSSIDTTLISSAVLRLYCTDSSSMGGTFQMTTSSNWNEQSVIWRNAPDGYGIPLHTLGPVQQSDWYEIDITNTVLSMSSDDLSLRIHSESTNRAAYSSKEGPEPPQLVLTIGENEIDEEPIITVPATELVETETEAKPTGSVCCLDAENGLFWPLWSRGNKPVECEDRPKWATGAYLKVSRSDCCDAFFRLQVDQCLEESRL